MRVNVVCQQPRSWTWQTLKSETHVCTNQVYTWVFFDFKYTMVVEEHHRFHHQDTKELRMGVIELLLMGVGLAMDAFAVSICKGLAMRKVNKKQCFVIALFFGGFQALMPFVGYVLGSQFAEYITRIDHWVAFILLGYIGGKMIHEAWKERNESVEIKEMDPPLDLRELLILAIATSIDALAVGITFAFLEVNIVEAISIIGVVTFIISGIGVFIGNIFGNKYKSKAEFVGGAILVILGVRILVEHLGLF